MCGIYDLIYNSHVLNPKIFISGHHNQYLDKQWGNNILKKINYKICVIFLNKINIRTIK